MDSGPKEGMLCLEPSDQSFLNSSLVARPSEIVMEKRSAINLVISYALDSRLMEGNTYLEHSAPGVYLDSGPTQGASCLEPLEQLILVSSLAARPVEGITKKVSDWKPVITPVQDINPDGRPMEGTTYPERLALGVSLDSGFKAGMSSIEPAQQSGFNMILVIQPDMTDSPGHPALASQRHHE